VTQALVTTGVAGRRHHEAFHRFFSRGTWDPDEVGRLLFEWISRHVPKDAAIRIALDDTLATKKGPHVFGIGSHLDAVRSTRRQKIFAFGHCWVVLAVLLPVPFSSRAFALPVLFRLYRTEKSCERAGQPHRKKTELARDLLDVLATWVGARRVELAADSAYCNDTITRDLPANFVLFGAMRPAAVLTALPSASPHRKPGRPSRRGRSVAKPEVIAKDGRRPWLSCEATLYGVRRIVRYKTVDAQWYRACGVGLLRIVIVKVDDGAIGMRVFFSTDATIQIRVILETYAGRWAIEVCFRELKQLLGFGDSSARKRAAVERTAPFVGLVYTTLVLWFAEGVHRTRIAAPPLRPWYRHKHGLCFADVLRAAQRALTPLDVLDPRRSLGNLRKPGPRRAWPHERWLRLAA
jgi:DDE superfamily endonuclease/Archaeal putative transposase ISC1217